MKYQLEVFCLFLLTFVTGMQRQPSNYKQLRTDCCCFIVAAAATTTGATAATLLQHQQINALVAQQTTQANELKNERKWQLTAKQYEHLIGDITPITTAVTTAAAATVATFSKSVNNKIKPQSILKKIKSHEPKRDIALDFKHNVVKLFANDAPPPTPTTTTTAAAVAAAATTTTMNSSNVVNILKSHQTERRHIAPDKLQYTKELRIKQGRLMGIIRQFQPQTGLRDVDQYLGLPYAEAPVGSRRFMPPGTPLPWQGLKIARHLPPVCPQKLPDISKQGSTKMPLGRYKHLLRLMPYLKTESEDCLYLNLYVPHEATPESSQQYPVLVFLHGESFEWNSGNPYDGSVLASYGEVIVVTVNYRLGILGFMRPSIDDRDIANFALLDQIAALHWIKENIGSFGGDNTRVTLMGHSTGAACVNYLMVSPVASGLFHRAILMSGSAMSDWAVTNHTVRLTLQVALALQCPLRHSLGGGISNGVAGTIGAGVAVSVGAEQNELVLECLRERRYQDMVQIPTTFEQFSTSLGPIVDGHVIPNQPQRVMGHYTEHFSRYDLLFGVTESESYHTLDALALEKGLRENERDNLLRSYMQNRFEVRPDLALAATLKKYQDVYNNPIKATNLEHRDVVLDILSDARVVGPLLQTGLFHADVNRRNYMYVFGHNSAAGPYASLPHSITGEELAFIFGAPLAPAGPYSNSFSIQEKLLSEAVMAYWTNFVKTGNPKSPWKGTFINSHALEWDRYDVDWPEFNKRNQAYLNIGIPPFVGYKYRQIYMNFWNKELPDELNQIANIQEQQQQQLQQQHQQPFLLQQQQLIQSYSDSTATYPLTSIRPSGSEVITGHMSKYGARDNGAEDPVRTLKLLLQEPIGNIGIKSESTADNMYNAPLTYGHIYKQQQQQQQQQQYEQNELYNLPTQLLHATGSTSILSAEHFGEAARTGMSTVSSSEQPPVAKSETTLQLLIGLIVVFILLNLIIYSTFLLQKKRKATTMKRKLGVGILSYDGATDDEIKRTTKHHDADDSYALDVVRKSNNYEAIKPERRSPINGYKISRQLSNSTVDTHTKVCEWMSGTLGANTIPCIAGERHDKSNTHSSKTLGTGSFGIPTKDDGLKIKAATDGTAQARNNRCSRDRNSDSNNCCTNGQEPIIELTKLKADDGRIIICQEIGLVDQEPITLDGSRYELQRQHSTVTESSAVTLHKHSRSDPVDMLQHLSHSDEEQVTSFVLNNVNVTSRDDSYDDITKLTLTTAQQLAVLKQRNYPKVLPTTHAGDSPPMTADLSNTYKRNSLPPNNFLQIFKQAPTPPPRTISTLDRKPSNGRRNSNNITTSPLMLAKDSEDSESVEPTITENTLIVGPIVPKTNSLKRSKSASANANTTAESQKLNYGAESLLLSSSHSSTLIKNDSEIAAVTVKTTENLMSALNSSFQSFECVPPSPKSSTPPEIGAHHTERIYAIQPSGVATVPSVSAAGPSLWPTPNGAIYAQPIKPGSSASHIPRMLPMNSVKDNNENTTLKTGNQVSAAATAIANCNASGTTVAASITPATASRIPQLQRGVPQLPQQSKQQNKDEAIVDTFNSQTTQASTIVTTDTNASLYTRTASTYSNCSSASSCASSSFSSSSSSTGTVLTELQQHKR